MKRSVAFGLLLLLFVAACTQNAAPPEPQHNVNRVIAMAPSFAETVIALGTGDRLIGRCEFCNVPGAPPFAESVGGVLNPDMEKIIALKPDVVLIQDSMKELQEKLAGANLNVLAAASYSLADVYASIRQIADLLEVPDEGLRLQGRIEEDLRQLAALVKEKKRVRVLLVMGHDEGSLGELYLAGTGSFLDELLTVAGGENVVQQSAIPYPKMSKEEILKLNPELIIVLAPGKDGSPEAQAKEQALWQDLGYLKAVKNGRVKLVTYEFMQTPGPRLTRIARVFVDALYGEEQQQAKQ